MLKQEVTAEEVAEVVVALDRHSRRPDARGRARKAPPHGGASCTSAWSARTRPSARCRRRAARARWAAGSEPPDRLVPVPGADRRGQDRAVQGAGRVSVRRRARHGAHRHVGIHGEAFGRPADRRAARLCRLRGGRPAHRGRAPPALPGDPASTRSRRRTPTSSTSCCRCWTTAG